MDTWGKPKKMSMRRKWEECKRWEKRRGRAKQEATVGTSLAVKRLYLARGDVRQDEEDP